MFFANFRTTTIDESTTKAEVKKWAMKFTAPQSELEHGTDLTSFFDHIQKTGAKEVYFHDLDFAGSFIVKWLMKNDYEFVDILDKEKEFEPNQWKYMCNEKGAVYLIVVQFSNGEEVKFADSWKSITSSYESLKDAAGIEWDFDSIDVFNDFTDEKKNRIIMKEMEEEIDAVMAAYKKVLYIYNKRLTKSSMAIDDFKKFYNEENKNRRQFSIDFGGKVFEYSTQKWVPHNVLTKEDWEYVHKSHMGGYNAWKEGIEGRDLKVPNGVIYDANSMHGSIALNESVPYGRLLNVKPLGGTNAKLITINIESAVKKNVNAPNLIRTLGGKYKAAEYVDKLENEERTYWEEEWEFIKKHYKVKYFVVKEKWFRTKPAFHNWLSQKRDLKLNAIDKVEIQSHKDVQNGFIGKMGQSIRLGARVIVKDGKMIQTIKEERSFIDYRGEKVFLEKGSKVLVDCMSGELFKKLSKNDQRYGKSGEYRHEVRYEDAQQRNHVGTSSYIYMRARIKLWNVIFQNLKIWLYSDSDSALFSDEPIGIPIHSTKYGYWKAEHKFDRLKVLRGKAYMFNSIKYWKDGRWVSHNQIIKKVSGLNAAGKASLNFDNFYIGYIVPNGKDAIMNVEGGKIKYKVDFQLGERVYI